MRKILDTIGVCLVLAAVPVLVWAIWTPDWLPLRIFATMLVGIVVCAYLAQDENGNYPDTN